MSETTVVIRMLRQVDFSSGKEGGLVQMETRDGNTAFTDLDGNDLDESMAEWNHFYPFRPDEQGELSMLDGIVRIEHCGSSVVLIALTDSRNPGYPTLQWLSLLERELKENDIWYDAMLRKDAKGDRRITDAIRLEV